MVKKGQIVPTTGSVVLMRGKVFKAKRSIKSKLVPALPSPIKSKPSRTSKVGAKDGRNLFGHDHSGLEVTIRNEHLGSSTKRSTNTPNDYMQDWLPKQGLYLNELLRREAPPSPLTCSNCGGCDSAQWWRCKGCCGTPVYCQTCCASVHQIDPFHRVEVLSESFFKPSWLWISGVTVSLCETRTCQPVDVSDESSEDSAYDEDEEPKDVLDTTAVDLGYQAKPPTRLFRGCKVLLAVHTNGVHHLPFLFCSCPNAPQPEIQLLRNGFYPSTSKAVRTIFTFQLLDDFLLQTVECFTSAHHYYSRIRRLTNEPFPNSVPDRTRELRRVSRQWRKLKELKRSGFGHRDDPPGDGQLALFCAACPQPGINLPANWENDDEQWKYTRSYVADGNFTCVHRKGRQDDDSLVYLKNGEGYMTNRHTYAKHLETTTEAKEPATCHEHRAVADKSKLHKGCDVTGVGAIACMRHGAFAPGSVVDFQKGERQVNMDFAFSQALKLTHTENIRRVILAYDINCQYSRRFFERFRASDTLDLPEDVTFLFAIGLFHVHGHQESCNYRYSLTFMEGAGMAAGEILESLWAVVNELARSTSTMTLAQRMEVLDALLADINWKKLVNIVPRICKGWKNARLEFMRASEDFELLNETASPLQVSRWTAQLERANRDRVKDVRAMDILEGRFPKPPSLAKTQSELMESEQQTDRGVGVTSWLALGVKIQEAQLSLKAFVRGLPKEKTDLQVLAVTKRREQIVLDINSFYEMAGNLFPELDFESLKFESPPQEAVVLDDDEDEGVSSEDNPFSLTQNDIEDVRLPLPSSFPDDPSPSLQRAREKELRLRIAQAEESLENIRAEIGHKSFLYRSNIRLADGKKQKTRGYAAVKGVDKQLRVQIRIYNLARWAIQRLGADADVLLRYRPVKKEDTRAITAVYNPNARGERNKPMSWIWNLNIQGDSDNSAYLNELYRVNWLRAKSRANRWEEEYKLLRAEMDWVTNFFTYKEEECRGWADAQRESPGHVAYARRQEEMWRLMRLNAEYTFKNTLASTLKVD
ncbi:hypothetical protein CC1G_02772 [Coprinopsis cinerea okayama7|uniref:CxC2-like cysteine cluster KDZ transposase-associated domain-containing protein n=1 Tax=Coprinopsis cinerea (strain Okayama-7 / 130 / ATCC MYA-4618 / FGSC 9003) TaxID=240176 RepID=A8N002_COPC7|nr:hypothetical protein CC1G_02772 [Coprinopsis cinerea okayama7\|eukprot:XP_001828191.2 hypothetical protein CC1G_02772 [Coprinopsis cinerea okayama7\